MIQFEFIEYVEVFFDGTAMISGGIKSSELSIKHLAKTFYLVLSFYFYSQIKRFGGLG